VKQQHGGFGLRRALAHGKERTGARRPPEDRRQCTGRGESERG
jgi:hypothetical protein